MTREEAIALLNEQYETCKRIYDCSADQRKSYPDVPQFMEALEMALTALRPVSREQAEKAWRGTWMSYLPPLGAGDEQCRCTGCGRTPDVKAPFCAWCGAAMTDEAVQMVMERLEAMKDD